MLKNLKEKLKKGITKKIVEYRIRIALQVFKKRLKDYMYFFLFW